MGGIILRGGAVVENPLEVALAFLTAYARSEDAGVRGSVSFVEADLRRANRGGARIAAAEIAAILERRGRIERALGEVHPDALLSSASRDVPWDALTRLFDAFAGIRGVGLSKMTKALHPKRPALIPMLDSVVQAYLADDSTTAAPRSFGDGATALVRSYKRDLDRNGPVLRELRHELASREHRLTEVRILDIVIWSAAS